MTSSKYGAFVISLDFELHWGVRDRSSDASYVPNLLGAREVIPQLLELFEEFEIAATWATVGFLFAQSKDELVRYFPNVRPNYTNKALDAYQTPVGENEEEDPLHYAPTLISKIARCPRQEIGTHTFSHYYGLERGQSRAAFAADIKQAVAIAMKRGLQIRSIVFPRNQVNPEYLEVLPAFGITSYRGNEYGWMYAARARDSEHTLRRAARIADQYLGIAGEKTASWADIPEANGLSNVRGSMFLRPYTPALAGLDGIRYQRIAKALRQAATQNRIFHLWWHPHNFGRHKQQNLQFLRSILRAFKRLKEQYNIQSLSMLDVAEKLRERKPARVAL